MALHDTKRSFHKKKSLFFFFALFLKKKCKASLIILGNISLSPPLKKMMMYLGIFFFVGLAFFIVQKPIKTYINERVIVSESEIVRRVKSHSEVPDEDPLSVVRVQDATNLRTQNIFYKDVKEGDYIVVYKNKIIMYDLRADKVIAEKDGAL